MGGHGALVSALRNPSLWTSVSAFAPICNPTNCPWGMLVPSQQQMILFHFIFSFLSCFNECLRFPPTGEKALTTYLGTDQAGWAEYDATRLMEAKGPFAQFPTILIDQGTKDKVSIPSKIAVLSVFLKCLN